MATLKIDTTETIRYARKLEKLRRNAMPSAVGRTLTNMAYEARLQAILNFPKEFTQRKSSIPKVLIRYKKNTEWKRIKNMKSVFGYAEKGLSKSLKVIAKRMVAQEYGGTLSAATIPTTASRGGKTRGRVLPRYRKISDSDIISGSFKQPGGSTRKSRYVAEHFRAYKERKFVKTKSGLFAVPSIAKSSSGKIVFQRIMIFSIQEGRYVRVPASPVIKPAGVMASKKGKAFFIKNAKYQLNRFKTF